jgi:hypothetical protein
MKMRTAYVSGMWLFYNILYGDKRAATRTFTNSSHAGEMSRTMQDPEEEDCNKEPVPGPVS